MFLRRALPLAIYGAWQPMPFRRMYTDKRPPLSQAGNNRTVIIALVAVALPTLAWFSMRTTKPITSTNVPSPVSDPAGKKRARRENEPDTPQALHPEQQDPELKAPFGAVHKPKRVDGPPDDRNHGSLSERNKNRAQSGDGNP
ncbi:hypothetical protein F4818DRAFT_440919 [Hypoxylon cercidicola]|nr:hypothetical protein F4818DRAFT_440919 [Hypoxylon cercidicola]